jgi:hypothetical protein
MQTQICSKIFNQYLNYVTSVSVTKWQLQMMPSVVKHTPVIFVCLTECVIFISFLQNGQGRSRWCHMWQRDAEMSHTQTEGHNYVPTTFPELLSTQTSSDNNTPSIIPTGRWESSLNEWQLVMHVCFMALIQNNIFSELNTSTDIALQETVQWRIGVRRFLIITSSRTENLCCLFIHWHVS